MKHHSIALKKKLIAGFVIAAVFAGASGVVGILGLGSLNRDTRQLGVYMDSASSVSALMNNLQKQRILTREAHRMMESPKERSAAAAAIRDLHAQYLSLAETVRETLPLPEAQTQWAQIHQIYRGEYAPARDKLMDRISQRDGAGIDSQWEEVLPIAIQLTDQLAAFEGDAIQAFGQAGAAADQKAEVAALAMVAVSAAAVAAAVIWGLALIGLLSKPFHKLLQAVQALSAGHVDLDVSLGPGDMLGDLSQAFETIASSIQMQAGLLHMVASGDYSVAVPPRSDKDLVGLAIDNLIQKGGSVMGRIQTASAQVQASAEQLSAEIQKLGDRLPEQAADIKGAAAELSWLDRQAAESAKAFQQIKRASAQADALLNEGASSVKKARTAVAGMEEQAQAAVSMIRKMGNIAYQINILAHHVGTEAGRSGQPDSPLATVAHELCGLAEQSTAAAVDAAVLLRESSDTVREGGQLLNLADRKIDRALAFSKEAVEAASGFAGTGLEESLKELIARLGPALEGVEGHSAAVEQAAATARDLAGQAAALHDLASQFRLREDLPEAHKDNVIPLFTAKFNLVSKTKGTSPEPKSSR